MFCHKAIFLILAASTSSAWADSCPIPTTSIEPNVRAKVTYDKKSKMYTYQYTLANGGSSKLPIDEFSLSLNQQPGKFASPDKWQADFNDDLFNFGWSTTALKPGVTIVPGRLPTPSYAIKPGEKITGFSITSSEPPGAQQFFAAGVMQPPVVAPTNTEDEPLPNCPGIDVVNPRLQTLVTGLTVGPLPANTVSPKMRLRDSGGEHKCGPIDPEKSNGNVTLLILSSPNFDASQINVSSIKFGPAQVAPTGSKLVLPNEGEDKDDEREEWERSSDQRERNEKKDPKFKSLLLTFDLKSLDVQCVLDRALFLNAQTNAGQHVIGGVSTRTIGCNTSKPGVHARHESRQQLDSTQKPRRKFDYKGEN